MRAKAWNSTMWDLALAFRMISNFVQVLLYNFFEDSVADLSHWRIVLNGVEGEQRAPNFERDEARYAGVCSEVSPLSFYRRKLFITSVS